MAYYRDTSGNHEQSDEQYLEIFEEFDFCNSGDDCSFFCPECRNMMQCAVYNDCKDAWNSFYS